MITSPPESPHWLGCLLIKLFKEKMAQASTDQLLHVTGAPPYIPMTKCIWVVTYQKIYYFTSNLSANYYLKYISVQLQRERKKMISTVEDKVHTEYGQMSLVSQQILMDKKVKNLEWVTTYENSMKRNFEVGSPTHQQNKHIQCSAFDCYIHFVVKDINVIDEMEIRICLLITTQKVEDYCFEVPSSKRKKVRQLMWIKQPITISILATGFHIHHKALQINAGGKDQFIPLDWGFDLKKMNKKMNIQRRWRITQKPIYIISHLFTILTLYAIRLSW